MSCRHSALLGLLLTLLGPPVSAQDGLSFYGFVNLGAMQVDDGAKTRGYVGENSNLPGRVGLWYRAEPQPGLELGFNLELGLGLTGTNSLNAANDDPRIDINRRSLRKLELVFTSQGWGRLSLGQGSMASDGAAGTDLSGTDLATQVAVADIAGGTEFLRSSGARSGTTIDDAFSALDGARRARIRYDSPRLAGFQISTAFGQEVLRAGNATRYKDLALGYLHDIGPVTTEAKISFEWAGSRGEALVASAAMRHKATGLNIALATGANQSGPGDYSYVKLGLTRDDIMPFGATSVSVDYYQGDDIAMRGAQSRAVGIGLVQSIDAWSLDLFIAHRHYALSEAGQSYQDISATLFGTRWRF